MLKWIAGTTAGVLAFGYLIKLNRASQNIETEIKAQVHKVSLSGISVKLLATIKNPNKLTLTLQQPLVTLRYEGKTLGSSTLQNDRINVPAFGQQTFEIMMDFGWLALVQTLGISLVDKIRNKSKSAVTVEAMITTNIQGIPYTDTQTLTLQL